MRMTLSLTAEEEAAVLDMMKRANLNKTSVIRSALRLYQVVDLKMRNGYDLAFVKDGDYMPIIIVEPGSAMTTSAPTTPSKPISGTIITLAEVRKEGDTK